MTRQCAIRSGDNVRCNTKASRSKGPHWTIPQHNLSPGSQRHISKTHIARGAGDRISGIRCIGLDPGSGRAKPKGESMILSPLDKARAKKKELKSSGMLKVVSPTQRALAAPKSLRKAVTAFCFECVGGDGEPGARNQVRNCTAHRCPLFGVRPWQRGRA